MALTALTALTPSHTAAASQRSRGVGCGALDVGLGGGMSQRTWWSAASAGAVAILAGLVALELVLALVRPAAVVVMGITVAAALSPIVSWLEHWLPRGLAVVVVYMALAAIVAGIALFVAPPLIGQLRDAIRQLPSLIDSVQQSLRQLGVLGGGPLASSLLSQLAQRGPELLALTANILTTAVDFLVVFFTSVYWLLLGPAMQRFVLSLVPDGRKAQVVKLIADVGEAMGGYLRGAVINGIIIGVLTYVGLTLIGVHFPFILSVVAGSFELLPVIGPVFAAVIVVAMALTQSVTTALITLAFVLVMHQFEAHVLVPNIMRSQTNVPSLLNVIAIFAGASAGGLLGTLVAIPITSALTVLVNEMVAPAVRRRAGYPIAPAE